MYTHTAARIPCARVDVAFISRERQPTRPKAFLEVAPELVVEIVSPSDRWSDLRQKIREYFIAGVYRVWIVDPEAREVLVFRSPTELAQLGLADTLQRRGDPRRVRAAGGGAVRI